MKKFTPLIFLASLGAGGISVIPFAFLNYTFPHTKGLIQIADVAHNTLPLWQNILIRFFETTMITFTVIHIVMSIILFVKLFKWIKKEDFRTVTEPSADRLSPAQKETLKSLGYIK